MNMLEERGITNEFAEKMSDFATDYEHKLYTNLLGQLQGFLTSKWTVRDKDDDMIHLEFSSVWLVCSHFSEVIF